jgi:hypothetical protein
MRVRDAIGGISDPIRENDLRARRLTLRLSRAALGRILDVDPATVFRHEQGPLMPLWDYALRGVQSYRSRLANQTFIPDQSPALFCVDPPKPRIAAVRTVDMSTSNAWAEFAGAFTRTHPAFLEHERAKAELKGLVPEDAQQAIGHGVHAKRSKSGAITFELLNAE